MPGMKQTLLGILTALAIAGCGQASKDLSPTALADANARTGPTFALFPAANYSYIKDVQQGYRQQKAVQTKLAAAFAGKVEILPEKSVYGALNEAGFIKSITYEEDIKPAVDTKSLESLLNEGWSDRMKSQIVDLIKSERKRNTPGIAIQDNHLDVPETRLLDNQAVINLGRELGADYIVRARFLEFNLRQKYEWEPLRRQILPFLRGERTLQDFGVAKATHYDPLDNIVIGGDLTDLGGKGDQGIRLQLWVQDATSGEVLWTNRREELIGGKFAATFDQIEATIGTAANELATDFLAAVAVDGDGDGVWDHRDLCPKTPAGVSVNAIGCPLDSDGDSVPDYLDQCPDTPAGAPIDENGCPLDSDGDSVPDYLDQCPDTPASAPVDENGCPLDSDGDGIPDYLDQCPETPEMIQVDGIGCPKDSDGDNIPDSLDLCPDTPPGVAVDGDGCPLDSDGDGVPDYLDECPQTPADTVVDPMGCPPDSDGDGIADALDDCPGTLEGLAVDKKGCPESIAAAEEVAIELQIQFDFDKAEIKPIYHDELEKVATFLLTYLETEILIEGHTDSEGDDAYNIKLSQRRSDNVKQYLVDNFGIDPARLKTRGFGENKPVADNEDPEGRAKNRRSVAVISTTEQ